MLSIEEYSKAKRVAASYAAVDPAPDSRYGRRLLELMTLIGEYERAHFPLTDEDIQTRVDPKRGKA